MPDALDRAIPTRRLVISGMVAAFVVPVLPARAQAPAPDWRQIGSQIAEGLNQYRIANGLPAIPISPSLTRVAQAHVSDLTLYHPERAVDAAGHVCNTHSWSVNGPWTAVCYTDDHAQARGMWSKPSEITRGVYASEGFEIAYSTTGLVDVQGAVRGWQGSAGHNAVILEQGIWAGTRFQALGVGAAEHFAVAWFGKVPDPAS